MNKSRRKELYAIVDKLIALQQTDNKDINEELDFINNDLTMILNDEECYMDNIPENLQNGYRYQVAEDACDNIGCAIDALNDGEIDTAINYIYSATL